MVGSDLRKASPFQFILDLPRGITDHAIDDILEFLSGLELPECYFWAVHPLDSAKIEGVLKDEKKQMLDRLSWSIDHVDESAINRTSRVGTL